MRHFIIAILCAAAALLPALSFAAAEKPALPHEETASKSVSGIVSGVSANFIAVEYGTAEKGGGAALEMAFNIGKSVAIENKKSIKDIVLGDTVEVNYNEITKFDGEGKKIGVRREAKKVAFLRPAPKTAESAVLGASTE